MSTFTTECYQNEYLPLGASEVNAIVTVTSDGVAGEAETARRRGDRHHRHLGLDGRARPEDQGGSAGDGSRDRLHSGRRRLRGHRGHRGCAVPYIRPIGRSRSPRRRRELEAKRALDRLDAKGGTAIGSWLSLAGRLFATVPGRTCHAILLTDGENQHETDEDLDACWPSSKGGFSVIAAASGPIGG